jgi:hypothetical protein
MTTCFLNVPRDIRELRVRAPTTWFAFSLYGVCRSSSRLPTQLGFAVFLRVCKAYLFSSAIVAYEVAGRNLSFIVGIIAGIPTIHSGRTRCFLNFS